MHNQMIILLLLMGVQKYFDDAEIFACYSGLTGLLKDANIT